ncbi:MAG TPA: hypothetical protein VMJ10_27265 [Kofleriaceae bacterium]|nr:hypothetical protein [Kofleriaceae bacterium]
MAADPEQLEAPSRSGDERLDREVKVRMIRVADLLGDDRELRRVRPEVLAQPLLEERLLGGRLARHLLHEALERRAEVLR